MVKRHQIRLRPDSGIEPAMDTSAESCSSCADRLEHLRHAPVHSARITELVRSNCLPLESEREDCERILSEEKARLQEIDMRVTRAQRTLTELLGMQASSSDAVAGYTRVLAPVRRLHQDALSEIFSWCVGDTLASDNASCGAAATTSIEHTFQKLTLSLSPSYFPWIVTRVCRDWRDAAISTAYIWSQVGVAIHPDDFSSEERRGAISRKLKLQLQRSGDLPLSVSLTCLNEFHGDGPVLSEIIASLLSNSHRWKSLHLKIPRKSLAAFEPIKGSMNALNSLFIDFTPPREDDTFEVGPNLRTLVGYPYDLARFVLPWTQITEFRFPGTLSTTNGRGVNGHNIALLRQLTSLERCELHATYDPEFEQDVPLEHPTLLRLTVKVTEDRALAQLLDALNLPTLQTLIMSGPQASSALLDYVERCKPRLLDLRVTAPAVHIPIFIKVLRASAALTYLHIKLRSGDGEIVGRVLDSPEIVPALRTLSLHHTGKATKKREVLLREIRDRRAIKVIERTEAGVRII